MDQTADLPKRQQTNREVMANERPHESLVEFLASMAELLILVLFIMTFVLQNFEIPSSSMEDTLLIGDHVLVNREQFAPPTRWMGPLLPYRDVRRNDIVVFLSPEEHGLFVVKRIMGVPGDRIHLRDGAVYRNGEKLDEPYVQHKEEDYNPYRDNFPAVPADRVLWRKKRKMGAGTAFASGGRRHRGAPRQLLCHGRQSRRQLRQPLLGLHSAPERDRPSHVYLLVIRHPAGTVANARIGRPAKIHGSACHPSFLR